MVNVIELARKAADLGDRDSARRAYELVLGGEASAPAEKLEAAVYILQSGGDYKISYTCFRDLYNAGHFQEDILPLMTAVFYDPNEKDLRTRYERNCKLLEKYPYVFRRDFLPFEDLPIRFFPYDDESYIPFYRDAMRFGEHVNFGYPVVSRNFFRDLDKPILAADVFSQYELEYLNDNVRKSEYVGRENHVYLHYTNWAVFCAYLQVLNLHPLLKEEKLVFLLEDEIGQYPIDFKARFGIDYSRYPVKPLGLREINRLIWHTQLSSHNGGDFFNEVLDGHPNLLFLESVMFDSLEEHIDAWRGALDRARSSGGARQDFLRKMGAGSRIARELLSIQRPTDKDIFVAYYLKDKEITKHLDPAARIAPAVFFQPHFYNIEYGLQSDEKDRTMLASEAYDKTCTSPIFRGFKYIKTFTPMRRFTTSHGATVRYMYNQALKSAERRRAGEEEKAGFMPDAVTQRVLNRSFMIDWQDRLYKDAVVVRFEDSKLNPKATFTALAAFLDLPYAESMTRCTASGEPVPYDGFFTDTVYHTHDDFINDSERKYIEYFLRDAYEFYGYDFHYYDGRPVTMEQVKEWLDGFTTIDRYIRESWESFYEYGVRAGQPEMPDEEARRQIQRQFAENRLEAIHKARTHNSELLMRGLRFINRGGQPLHMAPKLELDPALLENPIYH